LHAPATQLEPPVQAVPHAPQLRLSESRNTQALPQFVSPPGQVVVQTPVEHTCVPPQAVPHAPQLAGSDARLTHAPLQAVSGAGHWH
jgi:hypothetical protein